MLTRYMDGSFGLETVLVIRSVSTLLNYDYVWDMIFHPSGALEVRFHATGYISSAFLFDAAQKYGNQVGEHTLGTVHTQCPLHGGSGCRT
ncbi:Membrane primary amine oxidase [Manis javanica]|nr:Membrane primary amine oxidase [Manis javanica]